VKNSHARAPLKRREMVEKHIFTVFALSDSVNDDAFFPSGMGELNDKRVRCQEGGGGRISHSHLPGGRL
jgi:hypothetical protein